MDASCGFIGNLREADNRCRMRLTDQTCPFRLIGAMARNEQSSDTPLSEYYELSMFIEELAAARQL